MPVRADNFGKTVLLLGNYRPALTVARVLSSDGYNVLVSRDADAGAARYSRAVAEIWETPDTDDPKRLFSELGQFLKGRPDIGIVFPLMESYVRAFHAHADKLPEDRLYVMPNKTALTICFDKAKLLEIAETAGAPSAPAVSVSSKAHLDKAVEEIGFPLVIKPNDSTIWLGKRKALILDDLDAYQSAFPSWPDEHNALIVQGCMVGPRINLYFAAQNGKALRYLSVQIGDTDMPDGTGLATDAVTIELTPEVRAIGDALLAELGYHGVGAIQFLRNSETAALNLLEINPRIGGNHAITAYCGMDLEGLAIRLAAGEQQANDLRVGPAGIPYAWTTGALRGIGMALRNKELTAAQALLQALSVLWFGLKTRCHITFVWSDPAPTFVLLARLVPGMKRLL